VYRVDPAQDEPSRTEVPVQLGLDRAEQIRYVLVLVHQDGAGTTDESPRIGANRSLFRIMQL
jgi:hypothetical protein